jgi:murE/murF fusion protein
VFEIGMDKKGEINSLSKMVKPEIAIITNISGAHFKNFNTLKDIAKAKAEIINNISKGGDIILNADDKFFDFLSKKAKKNKINITSFSLKKKSDIYLKSIKRIKNYFRLKINVKNEIFYFNTKYSTNNFINNILACISVVFVLNLNLSKIKKKFTKFKIPEGRGDIKMVKKFSKRFKFIDESYNANPLSMTSAIGNMDYYNGNKKNRKLVFLGDMLELGKKPKKFHRALSVTITKNFINFAFGNCN